MSLGELSQARSTTTSAKRNGEGSDARIDSRTRVVENRNKHQRTWGLDLDWLRSAVIESVRDTTANAGLTLQSTHWTTIVIDPSDDGRSVERHFVVGLGPNPTRTSPTLTTMIFSPGGYLANKYAASTFENAAAVWR